MSDKIRISVILLSCAYCSHLQELFSSYFIFSFQKHPREGFHSIGKFHASTELACALRCSRDDTCERAIFHNALKKCALYQKKGKCSRGSNVDEKEEKSRIWTMRKIAILTNKGQGSSSTSFTNNSSVEGRNYTAGKSCRDIFKRHSSSRNGIYKINFGNNTWKTRCRGFPKCGDGVWELVMKVSNGKNLSYYDSPVWTTQARYGSVEEEGDLKLPGYWLRNFTRICVAMTFGANASTKYSTMVVNYTAQSLYSVMNESFTKTWPVSASTITTPPGINKNCLVRGLNMQRSSPWVIETRIGIQSTKRPSTCPELPYLVRGVGIGLSKRPKTSCGDIIISSNNNSPPRYSTQIFPAICKIYIQ